MQGLSQTLATRNNNRSPTQGKVQKVNERPKWNPYPMQVTQIASSLRKGKLQKIIATPNPNPSRTQLKRTRFAKDLDQNPL